MSPDNLNESNFLEFAIRSYTNTRCHGIQEFYEDLLLIKYLKRLFRKYKKRGRMEEGWLRLSLNHLIIFYNVFRSENATRLLFYKLEPKLYPILKTFLTHLNYMPAIVHGINGKNIESKKLKMDSSVLEQLKSI